MEPSRLSLPENAYRELKPGEVYLPVIPANRVVPELTPYSVGFGLLFAVVFSAAAAYLGLKIGQVFEAAIPIAILAVGISSAFRKKNALLQNVIVQSIGASSGLVVAGAIFTIPGLYLLNIEASFWQIFLASASGGILGMLFLIPFRKYFVKDMHGQFPFPEATATTEVLIAGEAGGEHAATLVIAAAIGGIYDFLISGIGLFKEVVSTRVFGWGRALSQSLKWEFNINIGAAVMGLSYIVGLKYSLIIACGSFVAWWVIIPSVAYISHAVIASLQVSPETISGLLPIGSMTPTEIFAGYVRHIGIGGIAAAGIIGVLKSSKIIGGAFKLAFNEITGGKNIHANNTASERTQRDISMKWNAVMIVAALMGLFVFFYFLVVKQNVVHALSGLLIVTVISFLFTTVAARAIAIVGTNPVSGMTLMTLILSSVILVSVGLKGDDGILAALLIGGVVCTSLSMAGGFITDLKIGYWLGSTPYHQERFKFIGTIVASLSVGYVIMVLYRAYGFGPGGLEAPQASAMAAVIKPLMTGQSAPWMLYFAGALFAIILEWLGIPPLAFALGMYLPLHLNTPILLGGLVSHFVKKSSSDPEISNQRNERGTLVASGYIAGGAIMGVIAAFITYIGKVYYGDFWTLTQALGTNEWVESPSAEKLGFLAIIALALFSYYLIVKKGKKHGPEHN